jgi:hypothetical protein
MRHRIESPAWFRMLALGFILALAVAEVGVVAATFEVLGAFSRSAEAAAGFVPERAEVARLLGALWAVIALQGLATVAIAFVILRVATTTIEHDEAGLALRGPLRNWQGPWNAVERVYRRRGILTVEVGPRWSDRWSVHAGFAPTAAVDALLARVPAGAALDWAAATRLLLRRLLPILVPVAVVGAFVLRALERSLALTPPP